MENDDAEFWGELQAKGLNVALVTQPANFHKILTYWSCFFMFNLQTMRSLEERVR